MVLIGGIKRALTESSALVFNGVHLGSGEDKLPHRVTIRRISNRNGGAVHAIVSIERATNGHTRSRAPEAEFDLDELTRQQLHALTGELSSTKENLQAAIEQLESSNEELQASNEELLASNETNGFDGHLVKPVDLDALVWRLSSERGTATAE